MISVVIPTLNDENRLNATLASLRSAAVDGFVRDVIIADSGSTDATLAVAEDAGARMVRVNGEGALAAGCAAARQPWFLLLKAGSRLQNGWEQAAWRHINDHSDRAGWFRLSVKADGVDAWVTGVRAALEAEWLGLLRAEHGLLISRRLFTECVERGSVSVSAGLPFKPGRALLRRIDARILA